MENRTEIIRRNDLFSGKTPMGSFWMVCKTNNRCVKPPCKKLLENQILKDDNAKYTDNRLKNKGVSW
jgi:hypothetical protein